MKKLLILPLLVMLTGCVTYYYPETALEDGVYYAEDDPSYTGYSGGYVADGYVGASIYPWSSLDYFYLGYNPYPRYGFGYGYGGYGSGFSFGLSYGYSPWYYPSSYYGYYSPWYASNYHYPYYRGRRHYNGYCSYHNDCFRRHNRYYRGNRHGRFAGNDNDHRRKRRDKDGGRDDYPADRGTRNRVGSNKPSSVNRYVSTAPPGHSGNRGMVIRSRETTKISKSRLEPDKSVAVKPVQVTPTNPRAAKTGYRSRGVGNEVRYRSGAKQSRSRTGPVTSDPSSKAMIFATPPSRAVVASGSRGSSGQAAQTKTTRRSSGRQPSRSASRPPTVAKPRAPSGNSVRTRSSAAPAVNKVSRNSKPTHRRDRN